jgi:hypothetical protein
MRRLAVLTLVQRLVLVVALAAALRVVWVYLACRDVDGGWFGYAALSHDPVNIEPLGAAGSGLGDTLLGLAFIAVWAAASLWLLGLRPPAARGQQGDAGSS